MSSSIIASDIYPRRQFSSITQLGLKALNLAVTHQTEMDVRLPGTIEGLTKDLDALGGAVPGAVQARHESQAATAAQNAVLGRGHGRVQAVREMVRKARAPKDVQRAYGVGQKTSPHRVRDVRAAIQQIVDRATLAPEEAARFGLVAAAVAELTSFLTLLKDADRTQEKKRANAPLSTKERNLAANRVLLAVALIAGAGRLAFADNPVTRARFRALMAGPKKGAPKTKTSAAPPTAPENDASAVESPVESAVESAASAVESAVSSAASAASAASAVESAAPEAPPA